MRSASDTPQRVHFVGIGGIGMSALARYMLAHGYEVSGSDQSASEQVETLAQTGASVYLGHEAEHVDGAGLVVYTSAVGDDNPEVQAAIHRRIPLMKRAELLARIVNGGYGVAVAGTHGKTTTSALIGHLLADGGLDPTILIGGVSKNLGSNARVAADRASDDGRELVVAEADEYDASFLHLRPQIAVITNVEPDHLDFYGDEAHLHSAFAAFAHGVGDTLVVCADDPILTDLVSDSAAHLLTYGVDGGDWRARDIVETGWGTRFRVALDRGDLEVETRLAGMHNVRNSLAAMLVARCIGLSDEVILRALAGFQGVARRFDILGEAAGVLVIDDYAHHPTEIEVNLSAIKQRFGRPIRLVFQPHTYSRTRDLLEGFASAMASADHVYLLDIYAARETDTLGVSSQDLARAARSHGADIVYSKTIDAAARALLAEARRGDAVVTMGAGDVYQLGPQLLRELDRG